MIYFITAREVGRVKIGFSENPRARFFKMRTDSPIPLQLERICDGSVEDERALHKQFSEDRLAGEWFTLSPAIEIAMASLPAAECDRKVRRLNGAFGRWLNANRITLTEAAAALGMSQTALSRFCAGVHEPSFAVMRAIHDFTDGAVTPSDIVFEWPADLRRHGEVA